MLSDRVIRDPFNGCHNNTDYTFPRWWGLLLERADDPQDPTTIEEAYETRNEWFVEQRVKDQMERQHEAGMWSQWNEERLEGGVSVREGMSQVENNDYKLK